MPHSQGFPVLDDQRIATRSQFRPICWARETDLKGHCFPRDRAPDRCYRIQFQRVFFFVFTSYKPAAVGNLKQPLLPYHPSTESSSIGRSQLYVRNNSHVASITNKVSNSLAKRLALHQIFPPYSRTAFTSPPFTSHPGV